MTQTVSRTSPDPPRSRFNLNRAEVVDENFIAYVGGLSAPAGGAKRGHDEPIIPGATLTCRDAVAMFESMAFSRTQDLVAREMRARGDGFHTAGSSGHEGNAVLGRLTRLTDLAYIHFRSGAFIHERARKVDGYDLISATTLSFAASREEPATGGRHKIWASGPLWLPPLTSTISSHLPRAVGAALTIGRSKRLGLNCPIPTDSIVLCAFGDASANHASAQTAFNAAGQADHQRLPMPIIFVCEDNGLGISVKSPPGWIESQFRSRYGLQYFQTNGLDLVDAHRVCKEAIDWCRERRRPVFLHFKVVRLLGHAGSDPETEYHTWEQIEAAEAKDPLLAAVRLLVETGTQTPEQVLGTYESMRTRLRESAVVAAKRPKLQDADDVMAAVAPYSPKAVEKEAQRTVAKEDRLRVFGGEDQLPERRGRRHMASLINLGLHDLMIKYPQALLFGQDVAKKGGVYHVTTGLTEKFGGGRVFNTPLDETMIFGLALGAGQLGMLPIPEIQYLAYYHNAQDQIRGEACSMQFFSNRQYRNPMVIRIAGWAYQEGMGGHFHNDNSVAAMRDVPGLVVATPSRGDDAVKMLRTCMAMAKVDGRVIAFIEPIGLYMTRDLFGHKDRRWSFPYPLPGEAIPLGQGEVYHKDARDLTIITYANGVRMSIRAAGTLRQRHNIAARVVDLRWLNPLNERFIIAQALQTKRVLIVDESRRTGGMSEPITTILHEACGPTFKIARLTGSDTYIPLGPACHHVLPKEKDIVRMARELMR